MDALESKRLLRRLSLCSIVLSTGMSLVWPINTIYMHEEFGQALSTVGFVLLLNSGSAFAGNILGGMLFDRWGGKITIIAGIAASACTVAAMGLTRDFYCYAALLTLLGFFNGLVHPLLSAIAVRGCPREEQRAVNVMFVSQNVGMAVGAAVGGIVASLSYQGAFLGNSLLYLVFLGLFVGLVRERRRDRNMRHMKEREGETANPRLWPTVILTCIGFAVSWFCYSQWAAIVPLHSKANGIPFSMYSLLWTINGGLILVSYPIMELLVRRNHCSPLAQIILGTFFFSVGLMMVGFSVSYWQYVAAMILTTCGEVLVFPAVPAWMVEHARDGAKGRMLGTFAASSTVGRMLGPLAGGFVYEQLPGHPVFTMASLVCFLTIGNYWFAGKLLRSRNRRQFRQVRGVPKEKTVDSSHI